MAQQGGATVGGRDLGNRGHAIPGVRTVGLAAPEAAPRKVVRVSEFCRRYDVAQPDEAPAGFLPEPPLWLMASTGSTSSW